MKHWTHYRINEGFVTLRVRLNNKIILDPGVFVAKRIWTYKK